MSDFDEQERRIARTLGGKAALKVNPKTLRTYRDYLKNNLESPCYLTGIEDFPWEERYVFGFGSQAEYKRLKQTQPSYTDTFELLSFDEIDVDYGLRAQVKRVSDKREFTLPLADLEATDEQSKNHQLLDDYSVWFVNYR
jgi:calcium binding protein